MSRDELAPTVESTTGPGNESYQVLKHPAFASMTLSHIQGGPRALFGSDVGSLGCVRIEIRRTELHRNLSRDWLHSPANGVILTMELTHAQFAEFITSAGRADGIPVTLRRAPTTPAVGVAEIRPVETKQETLRREIREAAARRLERMREEVNHLSELVESGKSSKKDLRAIVRQLSIELGNLPDSLEFVVGSAEEALEEATAAARVEVEAFVQSAAQSLGLQSLKDLSASRGAPALTDDRNPDGTPG